MNGDGMRALALIDGEHYPEVVKGALEHLEKELGYRVVALVFLGGTEKVADERALDFGLPMYRGTGMTEDLRRALDKEDIDIVLDLSDEPVLGYRERFRLICESLAMGVPYRGPDFLFEAPRRPRICPRPSVGVWGSGKRVGKTAVSAALARRVLERGRTPCVVTMGRGGPAEPELLGDPARITDPFLRGLVSGGRHAASDHFEDAMMGGVVAVGCRRCGGGMAGAPFYSNVREGAEAACGLESDVIVYEGSGAAIPPVATDAVLLVVSAAQPHEYVLEYLGPYRLLLSDMVVVTMCDDFSVSGDELRRLVNGIHSVNPEVEVVKTVFRPRPLEDLGGKRVFLASTAPESTVRTQAGHLEEEHRAIIVGTSSGLADRRRLSEDLKSARDAQVLLTELKAAGVDTVSRYASENGKELVYLENLPVPLEGGLEEGFDELVELAMRRSHERRA